jgi:hypothetical protein
MSKIKGSRLLRKLIPGVAWKATLELPYIDILSGSGWTVYHNGTYPYLIYRTDFDISGWSREQLSAFIGGAGFQESDRWIVNNPLEGGDYGAELMTWDIVSKAKMSDNALDGSHWVDGTGLFGWSAPGMAESNYNLEEVFAGRFRQFTPNTTLNNILQQNTEQLWGSGDATAGSKIYITRVISPIILSNGVTPTIGFIPPMAVIVPATLADEKDLVYMERLRRSYVLAESRNP